MTTLAPLRLALARLLDGTEPTGSTGVYHAVPVTARAFTSDGSDVRLLMEVRVESGDLEAHDRERLVHAVSVPAARSWIEGRDLAGLQAGLSPALDEIARMISGPLDELGLAVIDIELVAAEHVLAPASAERADGPE